MNSHAAQGDEILKLIQEITEIEWAKTSTRFATVKTKLGNQVEDRTSSPPYTSFRFKVDQPEVIKRLQRSLETHNGAIEWVLTFHERAPLPGINWTICPKMIIEKQPEADKLNITIQEYFRREIPEFGAQAYEDMIHLCAHLKKSLFSLKN